MTRTSNSFVGAVSLFLVVAGFAGCRKEPAELPPEAAFDEHGQPTGDPPFTSAEIHRERSQETDTSAVPPPTVPAKPTPALATPAPPPLPPPAPVAKPLPAPAVPARPAAETKPAPSVATAAGDVAPNQTGDWVLQVNVHRSQPEAQAQVDKLGRDGIPAYAAAVQTGDEHLSGNYWRVRVGRFSSRADAQKYGTSVLEPKGMKFWVDRKSNEAKQGN